MANSTKTKRSAKVWASSLFSTFKRPFVRAKQARAAAPHQSFSLTRKRDKPKKPRLESFIPFTVNVFKTLWVSKGLFFRFLVLYFVMSVLMIGIIQGNNLATVNELIDTVGEETDVVSGPFSKAFIVVTSSLGGALNSNLTEVQQFYMLAIYVFVALVTVWLLRQRLADKAVKLRDGLYSAGAPMIAIFVLVLIAVLQLLPFALVTLVYTVAVSSGFVGDGIEAGLFVGALVLVAALTLYFMTTTLFALMIATIPGTYPINAYKTAKKIVIGQRSRLLVRLLWLALVIALIWYLVLIPVALVVQSFGWDSSYVLPVFVQLVTGFGLIYGTSYVYLLYRRMIDDPVVN